MLNLFVVTGISGSGKTSALNMLEDLGYYCIDNLPVALIDEALSMLAANGYLRIAMSVDARDKESSKSLIPTIDRLQNQYDINGIFLTASTMTIALRQRSDRLFGISLKLLIWPTRLTGKTLMVMIYWQKK